MIKVLHTDGMGLELMLVPSHLYEALLSLEDGTRIDASKEENGQDPDDFSEICESYMEGADRLEEEDDGLADIEDDTDIDEKINQKGRKPSFEKPRTKIPVPAVRRKLSEASSAPPKTNNFVAERKKST